MSAKKEAKYYYVYYIEKNIYIWIVEFLVDTYTVVWIACRFYMKFPCNFHLKVFT